MKIDIYQQVTDRILKALESGAAPWVKPWTGDRRMPHNIVSKAPYRGINRLLLGMTGFASPVWGTYNQWSSKGIQVRKGEKATHIVLYKPVGGKVDAETGETTKGYSLLRGFSVFNADQTDYVAPVVEVKPFDVVPACEAYVVGTGATIYWGGDRACYIPASDCINMPNRESFKAPEHYYATVFHELGHFTGHGKRLDRQFGSFGSTNYATEELVAELASAYLCEQMGIQGELRHAGYIQSWIKTLKNDKKAIFQAASMAQKAVDYLDNLVHPEAKAA